MTGGAWPASSASRPGIARSGTLPGRDRRAREELVERVERLHAWGYGAEIITASRARELESNPDDLPVVHAGITGRGLVVTVEGVTPQPNRVIHAPELDVRPAGESRLLPGSRGP